MNTVKIIGAGSIGNHLSHAARQLGCQVDLVDRDEKALERTQKSIYPGRYGEWDEVINLFVSSEAPVGGYDLIAIGTPPDTHMQLALAALEEKPKALLIEKPLCTPSLEYLSELLNRADELNVKLFVGYDHVVGRASDKVAELIQQKTIGQSLTLDVEFREYWGGIFAAHLWLDGPSDTYLGYWQRGGGASGEHSHALNLWQHYAHLLGQGRIVQVNAMMDFVNDGVVDYDRLCLLQVMTETGFKGRIVQDVVTSPPRKWARIQGSEGYIEWQCGYRKDADRVLLGSANREPDGMIIIKSRPDDFICELTHIADVLQDKLASSPIAARRGVDTMLVIAAAHQSVEQGKTIAINYDTEPTLNALQSLHEELV